MNPRPIDLAASLTVSPTESLELSGFKCWGDDRTFEGVVSVRAGPFCCLGVNLLLDNFGAFVVDLRSAQRQLSGTARLRPDYEYGWLQIEYGSGGHVRVSGDLAGHFPHPNGLQFSFACDQSFMPPFIAQLEEVLRAIDD